MFAMLLLAMKPPDGVKIPTEEPTSEAVPTADPNEVARAMERILSAPVPKPTKATVSAQPVIPLPEINVDPLPLPPIPPQQYGGLQVPRQYRRMANSGGAAPPPPEPTWYEDLEPEGWQITLVSKIAVLALMLRWLHRKGWLAAAVRFARGHWAQVIGLLLLGFIALKVGGVDFPGWRAVLGMPDTLPELN